MKKLICILIVFICFVCGYLLHYVINNSYTELILPLKAKGGETRYQINESYYYTLSDNGDVSVVHQPKGTIMIFTSNGVGVIAGNVSFTLDVPQDGNVRNVKSTGKSINGFFHAEDLDGDFKWETYEIHKIDNNQK